MTTALTAIPLNQPSRDILYALINRYNGNAYNADAMVIGEATATPPGSPYDTMATVVGAAGSNIPGSNVLYWNRLNIASIFTSSTSVGIASYETSYDLLSAINAQYGLSLEAEDVILENVTSPTYTLKMAPGSKIWEGQVTLTLTEPVTGPTPLSTVWPTLTLEGFFV